MARIVYKEGYEGQNRLDCIEGIEIEMMNGQCALIYPKYEELPFADEKNINEYKRIIEKEIDALKAEDSMEATNKLIALGSPSARFVRQFNSNIYGSYNLPTLIAAIEISNQSKDINAIAKTIEGADLIEDDAEISTCFQATNFSRWFAYGGGFLGSTASVYPNTCVPTIVYKKPQTVYMVTSERGTQEDMHNLVDETKIFKNLDDAQAFAKRKFEDVLKIFDVTKDDVRVEEADKENFEEVYYIHANFLHGYTEWDVWVSIQKKEIE